MCIGLNAGGDDSKETGSDNASHRDDRDDSPERNDWVSDIARELSINWHVQFAKVSLKGELEGICESGQECTIHLQ